MNKSEKCTYITAINKSFYKNVFLLTQMVPPSFEFQQYFKKDMFDKPNTKGFLHMSQYLSVIYDEKLFKQMVNWPITCKNDETKYRSEIKNFLLILSQANPDINFPSILISHLIRSGGIKFLIIMWKLSQLALRAHIKRQSQEELLYAPHIGPVDDLTITYFNSTIAEKCNIITENHTQTKRIIDNANNSLKSEICKMNTYKFEIFDRKEHIKSLVSYASVHPLIQQRLTDVEDSNIIEMWRKKISDKILYAHENNNKLYNLEESCNCLYKLILRVISTSEILNANEFPKISNDNYLLYRQPKMQLLIDNLYIDDSIVFTTLPSLLTLISEHILYHLSDVNSLNLALTSSHIQHAYKNIKFLHTLFTTLDTKITGMLMEEQLISQEIEDIYPNLVTNNASIINKNILLQSPKISFSFDRYTDYDIYEKLHLSLREDKHKQLFKRYKRNYSSYGSPTLSDFSDSWSTMSGWLSPRAHFSKCKQVSYNGKPISLLYSRLLYHTNLGLKHSKENTPCSPNSSRKRLSLIQRKRRQSITEYYVTKDNYNQAARNLFNHTDASTSFDISSDLGN